MSPEGKDRAGELNIAEIPYESGNVRYRYSRYLSSDGSRWIRHGPFVAYHENGVVASEGSYEDGSEVGVWRDFHGNGQLAAEGLYKYGKESGIWRHWDVSGREEAPVNYGGENEAQ